MSTSGRWSPGVSASLYKLRRALTVPVRQDFHVLETLAQFPSVAPDLAVRRRSSSSDVWIPAEVLDVRHFDDRRDRTAGLEIDRGTGRTAGLLIGSRDCTASTRFTDNPHLRV